MNHRLVSPLLSLAAAALAVSGCRSPAPPAPTPAPPPVVCSADQIDEGSYTMTAGDSIATGTRTTVAVMVKDCNTGVEYWVKGTQWETYSQGPWTITRTDPQTCADWWKSICLTSPPPLTVSQWYVASRSDDHGFKCDAGTLQEPGTPAFLKQGDYVVTSLDGGYDALIYVDQHVEYWAMHDMIRAAGAVITADAGLPFGDAGALIAYACHDQNMHHWFTPSYTVQNRVFCESMSSVCPTEPQLPQPR